MRYMPTELSYTLANIKTVTGPHASGTPHGPIITWTKNNSKRETIFQQLALYDSNLRQTTLLNRSQWARKVAKVGQRHHLLALEHLCGP